MPGASAISVRHRIYEQEYLGRPSHWLGLSVVEFLGRLKYRLGVAFRLMRGQPVENVWQVF